nr:hypothetical protein B0A51_07925 [Rachicladosporium sp. CCFEE 5018]
MPSGNQIPIGLDPDEYVPCGCLWEEAMVELWAVGNGTWTQRQNNGKIAKMARHVRTAMRDSIALLLGVNVITYDSLTRRARQTAGLQGRADTGVQQWPQSS